MQKNSGQYDAGIPRLTRLALALALASLAGGGAQAFEIATDNPDVKALWDTTLKYSTAYRLKSHSAALVGTSAFDPNSTDYFPNMDDGDRNFAKGIVSNRLDVLTEFDLSYKGYGARVTGAAWYDSVYHKANDNDSPGTVNSTSVPYNEFTAATRRIQGGTGEILDAFVFGKADLGESKATFRAGKHTVLYGESFMMGFNGIAAAQAPIDVVKAATVPNSQFKEFMRPVDQLSGQIQITPTVSVGAYYMLDWQPDRLPAAGSYFSFVDFLGDGGERLIVGSSPAGNVGFDRQADMRAKKGGQGGLQLRWHAGQTDYGVYAVQWNDHGSQLYLHPSGSAVVDANGVHIGGYQWVYHEGIRASGASFSTTIGDINVAGEASLRWNTPLDSDAQVDLVGANNSDNPLYAIGHSAHAQTSWIWGVGPTFIANEADFVGEIGWNRRLSITKNANALNPNATRDATNIRMVYEPKYRQVTPGLDLSVPIGFGYGLSGNSSVVGAFLGEHTGDFSIGLNGSYLDAWRFGLAYTHYLGDAAPFLVAGHRSFKQQFGDRDFVSFNLRRTF